jgi:hypothetical protein
MKDQSSGDALRMRKEKGDDKREYKRTEKRE